jgi:hypothetical protein
MKALAVVLFVLAGGAAILAIGVVQKTTDPSLGTLVGAFVIPGLLGWWGTIALSRSGRSKSGGVAPTPESHVRCPECRELVFKDAKVCKHCNARLVPEAT